MEARLDTEATVLEVDLAEERAVEPWLAEAKERGFLAVLDRALPQFHRLTVRLKAPPRFQLDFPAEVLQVFPGDGLHRTAMQPVRWGRELDREVARQLRPASEAELSPAFRIGKMNATERFRLAMGASRPERQILLRDTSPQVLLGLLSHPRIEDKEVLAVVQSTHASGAIMERVAKNRKWMGRPEIRVALVKSPKTPPPLAIRHLDSLRTPDLGVLAKSSVVRESLRKAALKLYLKRVARK